MAQIFAKCGKCGESALHKIVSQEGSMSDRKIAYTIECRKCKQNSKVEIPTSGTQLNPSKVKSK